MRKFNSLIKSLLSTILILGLSVPVFASADTKPIEQFYDQGPAVKNVGGYTGILVEDAGRITGRQSRLIGMYYEQKNGSWVQKEAFVCREYSDPNCTNADNVWYDAVLDVCKSDSDSNCIVGVTAIKDGKEIPGKFVVNFPEKSDFTFKGDAKLKIPDGGLPSIWTFDGLTHQGGDKFMVFAEYFHPGGYSAEVNQFSIRTNLIQEYLQCPLTKIPSTPTFELEQVRQIPLGNLGMQILQLWGVSLLENIRVLLASAAWHGHFQKMCVIA